MNAIKQMGAQLQIVLGGSNDNNFSASDAANLVKKYHPDSVVMGNEFDNGGMSLDSYINNVFKPAAQAVRQADPNVKIAGAAWASYKSNEIRPSSTTARACTTSSTGTTTAPARTRRAMTS